MHTSLEEPSLKHVRYCTCTCTEHYDAQKKEKEKETYIHVRTCRSMNT